MELRSNKRPHWGKTPSKKKKKLSLELGENTLVAGHLGNSKFIYVYVFICLFIYIYIYIYLLYIYYIYTIIHVWNGAGWLLCSLFSNVAWDRREGLLIWRWSKAISLVVCLQRNTTMYLGNKSAGLLLELLLRLPLSKHHLKTGHDSHLKNSKKLENLCFQCINAIVFHHCSPYQRFFSDFLINSFWFKQFTPDEN